jgi:hypothetical protein
MVATMNITEEEVYKELLNNLKIAIRNDDKTVNFWIARLQEFVYVLNIKETKAIPIDKYEIL